MARRKRRKTQLDPRVEKYGKLALALVVVAIIAAIGYDVARVFIATATLESEATEASAAGAAAIKNDPINSATAVAAYGTMKARMNARDFNFDISDESFTVNKDHSLSLVVSQDVPLLIVDKYPPLKDFGHITYRITNQGPTLLN